MGRRTTALLAASVLGMGLLAACGTEDSPAEDPAAEEPEAEETTEDDGAADNGAGEVTTAESDLGTILVDGAGMTLYLFTQDSPGTSVCTDECLENWPPLEGEPTAGGDAGEDLLGSIERDDGTVQATYADWPLYYFIQDSDPGDVTGQGVEEVWYVLAPDGEMITEEAESSRPGY